MGDRAGELHYGNALILADQDPLSGEGLEPGGRFLHGQIRDLVAVSLRLEDSYVVLSSTSTPGEGRRQAAACILRAE